LSLRIYQEILAIHEFHETHRQGFKVNSKPVANPLASSAEFTANAARMKQVGRSTWKLPYRETAQPISHAAVKEEYRRLDLRGEGRLTILDLRSALELREVRESDQNIRDWFRVHDKGEKGYISFKDYAAIYEHTAAAVGSGRVGGGGGSGKGLSAGVAGMAGMGRSVEFSETAGGTGSRLGVTFSSTLGSGSESASGSASASASATASGHGLGPGGGSSGPGPSPPQNRAADRRRAEETRLALLRKTFDRYDVDGDGAISSEDLRRAYTEQGKAFTAPDLKTWVQTRDTSGKGVVSFEDFARFYK
jgi:Ca2+-binding EF-hand superfamily protein